LISGYLCEIEGCGKIFALSKKPATHMRGHTGKKPYLCETEGCGLRAAGCGAACLIPSGLVVHKWTTFRKK